VSALDGEQAQALSGRVARVASSLEGLGVDALLVDSLVAVRYLTGFTGSHGLALVLGEQASSRIGKHRFLTDFRYRTQAGAELPEDFELEIVSGELLEALAALLAGGGGRLGFDEAQMTVKGHRRLAERLAEDWELVACAGAVERLRAVKEAGEVQRIRAAAELADEALRAVLQDGLVGRTERAVAIELESRMRRLGAEAPSFPSIVAAGPHGALPHASPRDQQIPRDVLVTIDWGALHEGYCSDCTRTYATGEGISAQAREIYELVLDAQQQGLAALRAGPSGREVDAVARGVIERAGHGEDFGHGLGHGVGLEIHEGPRLSRTASEEPLRAGNVVTVEPGIYLPGSLGVRIEDLVVIGARSQEVLTGLSKELTVIG
jgi:Xaa-Pro aminopeptidase